MRTLVLRGYLYIKNICLHNHRKDKQWDKIKYCVIDRDIDCKIATIETRFVVRTLQYPSLYRRFAPIEGVVVVNVVYKSVNVAEARRNTCLLYTSRCV